MLENRSHRSEVAQLKRTTVRYIISSGEVSLPTTRYPESPAVVSEWEGGTGYTSPHTAWSGALELPGSAPLLCTLQDVGSKATALG